MAGATPAQGDTGRLVTRIPGGWGGGRCRIRVIDTFGTEPAYNHEEYATLHGYRTNWGYWNLNPIPTWLPAEEEERLAFY